jgi:hypothetical protein
MSKHTKPKIAGILQLIWGVPVVICFIYVFIYAMIEIAKHGGLHSGHFGLEMGLWFTGVALPFGILSVLGGIYALKRKKWGLVLAGAIAGIFLFWPISVAAIVMTILSKDEFTVASRLENDEST